jgi:hypothetical protein
MPCEMLAGDQLQGKQSRCPYGGIARRARGCGAKLPLGAGHQLSPRSKDTAPEHHQMVLGQQTADDAAYRAQLPGYPRRAAFSIAGRWGGGGREGGQAQPLQRGNVRAYDPPAHHRERAHVP